ncbi:MAG: family 1 glycosylhydrolase [Bacteroidetes Order II. Incertae sedis bacterium]|nr:family 1 glycosylhydrolase [Bacteroidetes Order II. bacterium]
MIKRNKLLDFTKAIPEELVFPKEFIFGAASASHQIEGGTLNNNWTAFEGFTRPDGSSGIRTGESCGIAADHWNRFSSDVLLMQDLGLGIYRFSIEWSRIEPQEGRFDDSALLTYRHWCKQLREAGIEPMVTLHHFSEPIWFSEKGGFENRENIAFFERFIRFVVPSLSDLVDYWITINEPEVFSVMGWMLGEFPPGKTEPHTMAMVMENILLAHARAYHLIHELDRLDADGDGVPCHVSIAKNVLLFDPKSKWNPADRYLSNLMNRLYNDAILEALQSGVFQLSMPGQFDLKSHLPELANTLDFIGLNHYTRSLVRFNPFKQPPFTMHTDPRFGINDMGWEVWAQSFYDALMLVRSLSLPIWVTENGICDGETPDQRRVAFLGDSLYALQEAIRDGANVRGYIHWSVMDNFEWAHGFQPRFGLFRVDYKIQSRTLTEGGKLYKSVIEKQKNVSSTDFHAGTV